jgi:hypothetical protein
VRGWQPRNSGRNAPRSAANCGGFSGNARQVKSSQAPSHPGILEAVLTSLGDLRAELERILRNPRREQHNMEYSRWISPELLKQARLSNKDVEFFIQIAAALNEAVKMRREALRRDLSLRNQKQEREERADDDHIFMGAALLLAHRMKWVRRK